MQKVLLAIDGLTPDKKIFSYAVQLCKRIKAELDILQILPIGGAGKYLRKFGEKAAKAGRRFEKSMMAATFAEAGEHGAALDIESMAMENIGPLLAESENQNVKYTLTLKTGDTRGEILDYVNCDRHVVLTIYDSSPQDPEKPETREKNRIIEEIKRKLPVPLVVVHS